MHVTSVLHYKIIAHSVFTIFPSHNLINAILLYPLATSTHYPFSTILLSYILLITSQTFTTLIVTVLFRAFIGHKSFIICFGSKCHGRTSNSHSGRQLFPSSGFPSTGHSSIDIWQNSSSWSLLWPNAFLGCGAWLLFFFCFFLASSSFCFFILRRSCFRFSFSSFSFCFFCSFPVNIAIPSALVSTRNPVTLVSKAFFFSWGVGTYWTRYLDVTLGGVICLHRFHHLRKPQ